MAVRMTAPHLGREPFLRAFAERRSWPMLPPVSQHKDKYALLLAFLEALRRPLAPRNVFRISVSTATRSMSTAGRSHLVIPSARPARAIQFSSGRSSVSQVL